MNRWLSHLRYNPVSRLLEMNNDAISLFVNRDLLNKSVSTEGLWQLPEPQRILRKQKPHGSWLYPGAKENIRTQENYNQLETYRNLGILIEEFGLNKNHPSIRKAAEYLFSFQTQGGDFRGIYGNQYSPNYSAGIAELLIKAGYADDSRIVKVFSWLVAMRQQDGGWAIPLRTHNCNLNVISSHSKTMESDKTKPFSHMVTGVVLRAFAVHPTLKRAKEAREAALLLCSSLFKKDNYPDRSAFEYWIRFSFPFWFTDLISALDSLSLLGFSKNNPEISKALQWFVNHQQDNGLWELKILKGRNKGIIKLWLSLAICRIFKRFYS